MSNYHAKWLLWSKIDFFGQNWPNDTFLDYFELVIPGYDSNWMFQTESNGIKLTQMTHSEHHVTNHVTYHVTNNLNFESGHLINRIQWVIQSGTSLKTDNLSKCSLSRTQTRPNMPERHVRVRAVGQARTKAKKILEIQSRQTGSIEKVVHVWHFGQSRNHQFRKKSPTIIFEHFLFDYHVIDFSRGNPRYENSLIFLWLP